MKVTLPTPAPLCLWADGQFDLVPPPDHFTVEYELSYWGILKSMRFTVVRDREAVFDVHQADLGVKRCGGKIWLQMKFTDRCVKNVQDHRYKVQMDCDFLAPIVDLEPEIDWPRACPSQRDSGFPWSLIR
ncbi:MAG: hypothetical protein WCS20_15305, partial [Alphaproteobacteria bacterium]